MIEVLRPGLLATVQDLGRPGFRDGGVPPGGAADAVALRMANLLVGNEEGAAAIEMTLLGPRLCFARDALVAIGGAEMPATLDGVPVPPWTPLRVRAGETLELGGARAGCRAYLACAGGIDVAPVLGSRSTYLPAAFGGPGLPEFAETRDSRPASNRRSGVRPIRCHPPGDARG